MKFNLVHLTALGLSAIALQGEAAEQPSNFIVIMMDDFDIGQFAPLSAGITALIQLSGEGITFTSAYASATLCAPSRTGVSTAMHKNRFGVYENIPMPLAELYHSLNSIESAVTLVKRKTWCTYTGMLSVTSGRLPYGRLQHCRRL